MIHLLNAHFFAIVPDSSVKGYTRYDCKDIWDAESNVSIVKVRPHTALPYAEGKTVDEQYMEWLPGAHIEVSVIDKGSGIEYSLFIDAKGGVHVEGDKIEDIRDKFLNKAAV